MTRKEIRKKKKKMEEKEDNKGVAVGGRRARQKIVWRVGRGCFLTERSKCQEGNPIMFEKDGW